ncbi:hypothetical protein KKI24_25075 [bacterium]|nr:hypothetical protein [bacterium]
MPAQHQKTALDTQQPFFYALMALFSGRFSVISARFADHGCELPHHGVDAAGQMMPKGFLHGRIRRFIHKRIR